jgi:hypothetical protein
MKAENFVQETLRLCGLVGEIEGRFEVLELLVSQLPPNGPCIGVNSAQRIRRGLEMAGGEFQALVHRLEDREESAAAPSMEFGERCTK